MANVIRVTGIRELTRAFGKANRALSDDLKDALAEAAAPVRSDAQTLAGSQISRMRSGSPWKDMRIGVHRSVAYVAPLERGVRGRGNQRKGRPRFGGLLLDRAMEPALERNLDKVERRFEELLDEVCDVWERA